MPESFGSWIRAVDAEDIEALGEVAEDYAIRKGVEDHVNDDREESYLDALTVYGAAILDTWILA